MSGTDPNMAAVAMAIQMDNERIENLERELADVRSLNEQYRSTNNSRSDTIDRLEKADQKDKARIEQLQRRLWDLLAVIHRDDGSYRADHGEEKAWQAAMQQVPVDRVDAAYYRQRIEQLKALLLESSDVIGKLADGPSHANWGEMLDSIDAAIDQNAAPLVGQKARGSQHENFADRADAPGRAAPVSVYEGMARRLEQIAGIEDSHGESAFNVQLKREAARLLRELERSYRALTTKESPSGGAMPSPNDAVRNGETMKVHELKTWPEFFEPIAKMEKTFELRKDDDRGFHAGDVLHLREWSPAAGYTGREIAKRVTYLLGGWGLERGYVCMALGHTDWTPNAQELERKLIPQRR